MAPSGEAAEGSGDRKGSVVEETTTPLTSSGSRSVHRGEGGGREGGEGSCEGREVGGVRVGKGEGRPCSCVGRALGLNGGMKSSWSMKNDAGHCRTTSSADEVASNAAADSCGGGGKEGEEEEVVGRGRGPTLWLPLAVEGCPTGEGTGGEVGDRLPPSPPDIHSERSRAGEVAHRPQQSNDSRSQGVEAPHASTAMPHRCSTSAVACVRREASW